MCLPEKDRPGQSDVGDTNRTMLRAVIQEWARLRLGPGRVRRPKPGARKGPSPEGLGGRSKYSGRHVGSR
jgi:hypothetical protein